jgi:lysophospholipase L1-like esterase
MPGVRRFGWLVLAGAWASLVLAAQTDPLFSEPAVWKTAGALGVEGQGWTSTRHPFDRLPAKAEGKVRPPVWNLAQDSAGLRVRFVTNARWIRVRWSLRKPQLALLHMPATGVSGLDLYTRGGGAWKWVACAFPERPEASDRILARGLDGARREYLLYLPLYNGIATLEIGVPKDAALEPAAPEVRKPIVFYGTSILQGGCASRPGMAYPSILGRRLDWPVINLGFSGNAKTEPELAELLAELDPAVYVLDSLPNLSAQGAAERLEPFYRTIRKARPLTPIVLVEHVYLTDAPYFAARRQRYEEANAVAQALYNKAVAEGDRRLYYLPGHALLGVDGEGTVDGIHPTDLGFLRMADVMEGPLRRILVP